ncbi:hypothetical protein BH747_06030 [Enterococcus villorum]|uniref:PrgI family protein n=1 Tax=Enterococcus villorum TaxID=112904 RepID=A0A1V8YNA4_9ENTE|nr:hypothetical protein BH747_06030 [Enterococcus villorum]OQO73826.1 hypothetical protein BH744_08540 [Enterococcus villorum]
MGKEHYCCSLIHVFKERDQLLIEVPIRKEILTYQEKLFFGFSLRQFISGTLTVIFVVTLGIINHLFWRLPIDDIGLVFMFISAPILSIGWLKPNHLPLEKYLLIRWNYFKLAKYYTYLIVEDVQSNAMVAGQEKRHQRKQCEYGN